MEKLNDLKSELREMVRNLKLSEIPSVLDGVNDVRRCGVSFGGFYTCNSDEGVQVIGKDGLTLKLKTDNYNEDYDHIFEEYVESDDIEKYNGEIENWNGEFNFTIDETTSIYLLCFLLKM